MDVQRVISGLLGFPLVLMILLLGNKIVVDVALAIIALLSMNEYLNAVKKVAKPVEWIAYLSCFAISFIHVVPQEYLNMVVTLSVPTILIILFAQVIATDMKTTFKDIAYVVGKYFGKHKFSKVSPKKSIEGCIGGVVGTILLMVIYTYFANNHWGMDYSYLFIIGIGIILSLVGQIGDFAASSIKRYVDIKDYSNLIPGHGGMLDRIDSLIFLAPFAYALFTLL